MKRLTTILVTVCVALSLVGCDAVQKKFTRKKKAQPKKPKIYQLDRYEKKPTPELYNKHYIYWESWSGELIELLGQNHKKDVRCFEELMGQLNDMQNILVPEKAAELQKHIDKYEEVRSDVMRGDMSYAVRVNVKTTLERQDRAIKRDFITSKIKNYIKESFEEGSPATVAAPAAAAAADQASAGQ